MMYVVLIAAVFILAGLQYARIDVTHQYIDTGLNKDIVICVLADLHCRRFGEKQSRILKVLEKEKPDIVVIPGDLFDVDRDFEISFELLEGLKDYPVYFCSGNHDMYLNEINDLRKRMSETGVHVIEDCSEIREVQGKKIRITGLTDHGRKPVFTPQEVKEMMKGKADYDVVLYHRPAYPDYFKTLPCNLVISGHAHGGQWCIPFTRKGLYAPQEGLFPKYTAGMYKEGSVYCCISRGLASGTPWLFRLYNNPEIVMIHLGKKY